jgi:thymidylate kinase
VLTRLVPAKRLEVITNAIASLDLAWFANQRKELQAMLAHSLTRESIFERIANQINETLRRMRRVLQPTGLVVAVLGPDGSGKTTVIEHLERELAPAFRQVKRFHLRPHFGQQGCGVAVTEPHASPPRNCIGSFAKMVLFTLDYWSGYLRIIYPEKARSTLIIFDRHFYDMLVDPKRYRLAASFWIAKLFVKLVPKPDIWLVLDAPAALLVSRKGELNIESATTLRNAYVALAQGLSNAHLVNTGGTLEQTYENALLPVLTLLHQRISKRLG